MVHGEIGVPGQNVLELVDQEVRQGHESVIILPRYVQEEIVPVLR